MEVWIGGNWACFVCQDSSPGRGRTHGLSPDPVQIPHERLELNRNMSEGERQTSLQRCTVSDLQHRHLNASPRSLSFPSVSVNIYWVTFYCTAKPWPVFSIAGKLPTPL